MFSFHKPKIYRSNNGCCICGAKSSSSRFTDSTKYEEEFEKCFRIRERRSGEICNACVLLVKRWKKLPDGTNRHWNHVVDARAGPGTKSTLKIKNKLSPSMHKYKSPLKSKRSSQTFRSIPSPCPEELSGNEDSLDKSDIFSQAMSDSEDSDNENSQNLSSKHINRRKIPEQQFSPFLDLTYWKKTEICCGIIFKGLNGEVLVDQQLLRPCRTCRKPQTQSRKPELRRSTSLEDTDSNASTPSFAGLDFYNSNRIQTETPPDSPPDSPENMDSVDAEIQEASHTLTSLQCSRKNMDYAPPIPITLEC